MKKRDHFGHTGVEGEGSTRFKIAEQVLPGKDQGDRNMEAGEMPFSLSILLRINKQAADFLIEKELVNLVFTENDVCYNPADSGHLVC